MESISDKMLYLNAYFQYEKPKTDVRCCEDAFWRVFSFCLSNYLVITKTEIKRAPKLAPFATSDISLMNYTFAKILNQTRLS